MSPFARVRSVSRAAGDLGRRRAGDRTRPKLIEAFNEIRGYGVKLDKLIDLHEQNVPEIDKISEMLVRAGAEHVMDRIKPGQPLPPDAEIAELITMLVRFRAQAVATVTATLASSIESNIESLVSRILAEYLEHSSEPAEGSEGEVAQAQ